MTNEIRAEDLSPEDAATELARLAAQIRAADDAYYRDDAPEIDDAAYDALRRRNAEIEAVTLEDVQRIAKRLLDGKTPLVVTVGPQAS